MTGNHGGTLVVLALVVGAVVGAALVFGALGLVAPGADDPADGPEPTAGSILPGEYQHPDSPALDGPLGSETTVEQFGSEEAFRGFVRAGQRRAASWRQPGLFFDDTVLASLDGAARGDLRVGQPVPESAGEDGGSSPNRIAGSNVQVAGLDEPDIVKTDGGHFYYSPARNYYPVPIEPRPIQPPVEPPARGDAVMPPDRPDRSTHVIDVGDPADPAALEAIDASGQLLQTGDTLVVFDRAGGQIRGFDVSDPGNPVGTWNRSLDDHLVTAREADGTLYVVTRTAVGPSTPCPIRPLGEALTVPCGDIYAPTSQTSADATYTAVTIDATEGTVEDSVSIVGTGANTVVYMSHDALYVTDTTGVTHSELRASWAAESEIVPQGLADRIEEIRGYDISETSKRQEIRLAVREYASQAGDDDGTTLAEDFRNYRESHQENLTQTAIVRVDVDGSTLEMGETGTVPGKPLNQFALDEYRDTLRITTTIPRVGDAESDNHLHVLDNETLAQEGSVKGLGHDQRVYSVRYVGDTAYVVTFRQIDPFYVVDFEDPTDPEVLSELELPGFSSYLHPADDDHVIGIGEEEGRVKATLFDVSDPTDTSVADDLKLDSYWSAIDDSHHAFMIDRRHEVFFLPAGNEAKIVDYADGSLEVVAELAADSEVTRARYVGDHLYVFAGQEVIVLDQTDWERTTTLTLGEDSGN